MDSSNLSPPTRVLFCHPCRFNEITIDWSYRHHINDHREPRASKYRQTCAHSAVSPMAPRSSALRIALAFSADRIARRSISRAARQRKSRACWAGLEQPDSAIWRMKYSEDACADAEIGNHTVFHRRIAADIARHFTRHQFRLRTDRFDHRRPVLVSC